MKNVMVRAWEIAKAAMVKFGGKVKEYFAQALTIAWGEVKNVSLVAKDFGLVVLQKTSNVVQFVIDEVAGLNVFYAYNDQASHAEVKFRTGHNKQENKGVRLYNVESYNTALEFTYNGKITLLKIEKGNLVWA